MAKGRKPLTREECFERYGMYKLPRDPAERMRIIQPWKKSTGPKTELGKQIASRNNFKHGLTAGDPAAKYFARLYWEQNLARSIEQLRPYLPVVGAKVSPDLRDMILEFADNVREAT